MLNVSSVLHYAVAEHLRLDPEALPIDRIRLVRKSLDARPPRRRGHSGARDERDVCWSHVVDVHLTPSQAKRIKPVSGRIVPAEGEQIEPLGASSGGSDGEAAHAAHTIVIGAGPCGLFAALTLARAGHRVTLVERGKPVEERGRSIGALIKRGVIDPESNFCYGEGGAGTWSDGKLTTRIGRNSAHVRAVLETLVAFGAPSRILLDGKPHLGTDNLVRMLKNFRAELLRLGAEIRWDARVDRLVMDGDMEPAALAPAAPGLPPGAAGDLGLAGAREVRGVRLASGETLLGDAVVLAAGHSARELYMELVGRGATLVPKDFAVGFRIEHPQQMINAAQYGTMATYCEDGGRGLLPPASYRLATTVSPADVAADAVPHASMGGEGTAATAADAGAAAEAADQYTDLGDLHPPGIHPPGEGGRPRHAPRGRQRSRSKARRGGKESQSGSVARGGEAGAGGEAGGRGIYSFCMCPGGQIVPTSIVADRLCINGMSYSNRGSKWANSAVVVSVGAAYGDYRRREGASDDANAGSRDGSGDSSVRQAAEGDAELWWTDDDADGPPELAGLRFQEAMEARAAAMGGEGLICPVQRVSDFLEERVSTEPLPASSYRRGVCSAPLHLLYPPDVTAALRVALRRWGRTMAGFDGENALLHGVETRTSAPVQITRHRTSCEAVGLSGLFPAGEGAGYAGGIVSAAVDGLRVAEALLDCERLSVGRRERASGVASASEDGAGEVGLAAE